MKRLLVVGFGDIARRAAPLLASSYEIVRATRSEGFDLDRPETLAPDRVDAVLHLAPPPAKGDSDTRSANLLESFDARGILPARFVYVSTSGVYGDCGGARIDESRAVAPQSGRARRRVDAERRLALWCTSRAVPLVVLRVPGIYAADRLPLERLRAGTPVLRADEDVFTNHIHADDLAAIAARALEPAAPAGIYNTADDSELRMGDWFDLVADRHGLPRPPRLPRAQIQARVSPELYSFMTESRRLDSGRLKRELGVQLRYPTVYEGLRHEHAVGID